MKRFLAIFCTVAALMATPLFASEENPCGNHGNHCCTGDGGQSYVSVEDTCTAFCSSVSEAVAVATSECEAKASAKATAICGDAVNVAVNECEAKAFARSEADAQAFSLAVSKAVSESVAASTASCAQSCVNSCSEPICLNARKKSRTIGGVQYTVTICRDVK